MTLDFVQAINVGSLIIGVGVIIYKIGRIEKREISPQPLRIQLEKEFATKKELQDHRDEMNRVQHHHDERMTHLERKLENDKEQIIEAGEVRAVKLHERINAVMTAVGEVRGELKGRFSRQ